MLYKAPQEKYAYLINKAIPGDLEILNDTDPDSVRSIKRDLYAEYRTLAVLEWHLHHHRERFRQHLKTALRYERERFIEAYQKNPSLWYYCPLSEVITCLCTGDFTYAKEFTTFLDDYNDPNHKHHLPWMYNVLVTLVLGRYQDKFDMHMGKLKKQYSTKRYTPLLPQISLFEAIQDKDEKKFHQVLDVVANTYKPVGVFYAFYEDQFLYMKMIAVCNLARGLGMKVDFDHPFIPKALIGA